MDSHVPIPAHMARLPRDHHGRPIPWFAAEIDGERDFRVVEPQRKYDAVFFDLCWVCGEKLGRYRAYTIGPMCCINRISAEPPTHVDCAHYAAQACPFLVTPQMRRRETHLPDGVVEPGGVMVRRNPGAVLVWVTRVKTTPVRVEHDLLFDVGEAEELHWYCEGRTATRAEVLASIESGLPLLRAEAGKQGSLALRQLDSEVAVALTLLPAEQPGEVSLVESGRCPAAGVS